MNESFSVCERCGRAIFEGMWPFCPHPAREGRVNTVTDEIPGGRWLENYGPKPIYVESYSEIRRLQSALGLQEREKFSPTPGTDHDPAGIPNPAGYVDAQTMENVAVLLARQNGRPDEENALTFRNTFVLVDGGKDANAILDGDASRMSRVARRIARATADRPHP